MPIMKSLFDGKCASCGKPIKAGEHIDYRGKGNVHHYLCVQGTLPFIEWEEDKANALADSLTFFEKGKGI